MKTIILSILTLMYFSLTFCSRQGNTESPIPRNPNPGVSEDSISLRPRPDLILPDVAACKELDTHYTQDEYDSWYECTHKDSLKHVAETIPTENRLKFKFFGYGPFHFLARWELGREYPFMDGKDLCHFIKGDRGKWTCLGVAYHANKRFFDNLLGHTKPTIKKLNKLFRNQWGRRRLADWYFNNYVGHFYRRCSFKAAFFIGDLAVTSGPRNAIRILQRSHKLAYDGLWGPQSEKACQKENFNPLAYIEAEKARYIRLAKKPDQAKFRQGWLNRSSAKLEFLKKNRAGVLKQQAWDN